MTSKADISERVKAHRRGKVEWTKKYPPIEILKVIKDAVPEDEDKYVKMYMERYGIENVRGGSYSRLELPPDSKSKETCTISNTCFVCNKSDHYVNRCIIARQQQRNKKRYDELSEITEKMKITNVKEFLNIP